MIVKKDLFVFIGPPGSGKGTLSNMCTELLNWVQLSTGNLCRKHIAEQTEIGKEIALAINSGKLISDSLITSMVEKWLLEQVEQVSAIILDGYPRAVAQAEALHAGLKSRFKGFRLTVVKFSVADDNIINRLTNRLVCKNSECQAVYSAIENSILKPKLAMKCDKCFSLLGQRKDDELEAVKERLNIYRKHTDELLNFYKNVGQPIIEIDAGVPLIKVFEDFKKLVGFSAHDYDKK